MKRAVYYSTSLYLWCSSGKPSRIRINLRIFSPCKPIEFNSKFVEIYPKVRDDSAAIQHSNLTSASMLSGKP